MSEKRFTFFYERGNEVVFEDSGKRLSNKQLVDLLNELDNENEQLKQKVDFYKYFQKDTRELEKENEYLQKQIQNYEQLISNSYEGEEERLDGWFGKYVIWEDELQKYKEKIKGVFYE